MTTDLLLIFIVNQQRNLEKPPLGCSKRIQMNINDLIFPRRIEAREIQDVRLYIYLPKQRYQKNFQEPHKHVQKLVFRA